MQKLRTGRALTLLVVAAGAALAAVSAGVSAEADGWDTHGDSTVQALAGANETHTPNVSRASANLISNQLKAAHEARKSAIGNLR